MIDIQLQAEPLSIPACLGFADLPEAGGLVLFSGNVRNQTKGRRVLRLEYEAYAPMAISEMKKIAEKTIQDFGILRIAIHHRTGVLAPGEPAVLIAVSAPHRQAAFAACQYAIDTLKETVPIWKKEVFEDGEVWVSAHP